MPTTLTVEEHFHSEAEDVRRACDEACFLQGAGQEGLADEYFHRAELVIEGIGLCGADTSGLVAYLNARREAVTPPGEAV